MREVITVGPIVADYICPNLPRMPKPSEYFYVFEIVGPKLGGPAVNVAVDLKKLGIKSEQIGLVGAVGKDMNGKWIKNEIKKYEIDTSLIKETETSTAMNFIPVVKGEDKRYFLYPGANLDLNPDYLKKVLKQCKPKALFARPCYTGIDLGLEPILKDLKDTFVILDTAEPYKKPWNFVLPMLKHVDVLHCNDREARGITGEKNTESAIKKLLKYKVKLICLTKGAEGAELITQKFRLIQPSYKVPVVDPTGCGDAFCSGIIYNSLKLNKPDLHNLEPSGLTELLAEGQACGAACLTAPGCTTAVSRENVDLILNEQKKEIIRGTIIKRRC